MVATTPSRCRHCGGRLDSLDHPGRFRCLDCGDLVFPNPTPNARVVVVDRGTTRGDESTPSERPGGVDRHAQATAPPRAEESAALLVEIADESRLEEPPHDESSVWMLPGGHVELEEQPAAAAARELEEETNLTVDPADLTLFDAVTRQVVPGAHGLVVLYAVDRAATAGSLAAATDASDARFWTPPELAAATGEYREMHREPARYRSFERVVEAAGAALD